MSVKRQWKVAKLSQLSIDPGVRRGLIEAVLKRSKKQVMLYAWKVNSAYNLAERAFFTQTEALTDWYLINRVWETTQEKPATTLYAWSMRVDDLVKYIQDGELRKVPVTESPDLDVAIIPSDLQEDIQRSLKKQG